MLWNAYNVCFCSDIKKNILLTINFNNKKLLVISDNFKYQFIK